MKVEVSKETEREMEIVLDDLTIASMLSQYLKKDDRVEFASFSQEHPLEEKVKLYFRVKEDEPRKVLKDVLKKAISDVNELREKLLSSLS